MKMLHSIFVNVLCKLICIFYGSEINLKLKIKKKLKIKCRLNLTEGGGLNFSDFSQIQITEI